MSTSKAESERRIGTTIGKKWYLESLIAYSSVAATYRARHRNGLDAAIKIIHRTHGAYAVLVERFLAEAHLANRVEHPGVERVFDDGQTEDGCVYLVMELLSGETLELRRMSEGGALPLERARPIFDGILDALIAVHAAGVVHRNLKPGNVILTTDGRVVITDFGRARLSDVDASAPLSIEGMVLGSPAYMPPEQARGKRSELDVKSDIWAAGAIMFTVLSGRRVHEAPTQAERRELAAKQPAPPLSTVMKIDPPLGRMIDRAVAFEKSRRWDTAAEMRRAFWIATGRDPKALPPDPIALQPAPAPADAAVDAPDTVRDLDPDLLPPHIGAFVEEDAAALREARRRRRWRIARRALAVTAALAFVALSAWFVMLATFDDDPPSPARPSLDSGEIGMLAGHDPAG